MEYLELRESDALSVVLQPHSAERTSTSQFSGFSGKALHRDTSDWICGWGLTTQGT